LSAAEIEAALAAGRRRAARLIEAGLIEGAILRLQGTSMIAGSRGIAEPAAPTVRGDAGAELVHA
jgi:hypothetical protein